jgi:hypothetical protein
MAAARRLPSSLQKEFSGVTNCAVATTPGLLADVRHALRGHAVLLAGALRARVSVVRSTRPAPNPVRPNARRPDRSHGGRVRTWGRLDAHDAAGFVLRPDEEPAWVKHTVKALARGAFREEVLWTAGANHVDDLNKTFVRNGTKIRGQVLVQLHPTDDVPDDVPAPLYAYTTVARGSIGPAMVVVLETDLDALVRFVWTRGMRQAGDMQAARGNFTKLAAKIVTGLEEAARYDDVRPEEDDSRRRGAAKNTASEGWLSGDHKPNAHLEDQRYARKAFRETAKVFKDTHWNGQTDDAAARVMNTNRDLEATKRSLKITIAEKRSEIEKMQRVDAAMENETNAGVDSWFDQTATGSRKSTSRSAYERYMQDPANRDKVRDAF